jgi:hypothetical protein
MLTYAAVTIALLVASALALEWYFRRKWEGVAIRDDLYADPRWRKPAPFIMFKGKPNHAHLNALGYPGAVPVMPRPADEYRVVIIGGSTVFNGEPTLAEMLERHCHRAGFTRVRVYNGGVISSSSGMELARMVFEFADLAPNLVVFYNGGNDLLAPHVSDPRPGYPPNYVVHEANPILQEDVRAYPFLPLMLYGSIVLRYRAANYFHRTFVSLGAIREAVGHRTPAWQDALVQRYVGNLVKAGKIAGGLNTRFAAFFQPLLLYKDAECVAPEEQPFAAAPGDTYWMRLRERVQTALAEAAQSTGLHLIDLSGMFSRTREWIYTDAIHIHRDASDRVAARVCDALCRGGLLS